MNRTQKGAAFAGIGILLLTALLPCALPLVICLPLVAAALACVVAPAAPRREEPLFVRPVLASLLTPRHLARAALPSLPLR